jgi:gliding motility-associated-like protein
MNLKRTGDYFVTGTAKSGCTAQLKFTGSNFESLNYTIQSDNNEITAMFPTLRLWSETISYSDYFWDFGDSQSAKGNIQDHTYNITQDGYYDIKLKVVNPNGCLEYATKRIWITDASKVNILTPNGDGRNDLFLRGFHIQVYNRNGFLLYEGIDGWDGKYNGKLVSSDTYFYVLFLEGQSGVKTKTGFVTVIL